MALGGEVNGSGKAFLVLAGHIDRSVIRGERDSMGFLVGLLGGADDLRVVDEYDLLTGSKDSGDERVSVALNNASDTTANLEGGGFLVIGKGERLDVVVSNLVVASVGLERASLDHETEDTGSVFSLARKPLTPVGLQVPSSDLSAGVARISNPVLTIHGEGSDHTDASLKNCGRGCGVLSIEKVDGPV